MTVFHYLDTVDSPQSARRFLEELERAGLLYHPEESAQESIAHHGLAPWALAQIDRNMKACFDHLADPCDDALAIGANAKEAELVRAYDAIVQRHNLPDGDAWENLHNPSTTDAARRELSAFIHLWESAGL